MIEKAMPEEVGRVAEDEDGRLLVNPAMKIVRANADEIFVEVGSRSRMTHRIEDSQVRGGLADFVSRFRSPQDPEVVAAELGLESGTAAEYIEHLIEGRVLIPAHQARYSYLVSGFGWDPGARPATVAIAGAGRIAENVAWQLSELLTESPQRHENVATAFDGADLVVVASDRPNPGLCYDADELAQAMGTPWHLTYFDGFELMVGPTFRPGASANYYDFDSMNEAARVMRTPYLYGRFARAELEPTAELPAFMAAQAASWTVIAIAQHLWGQGSFLEGYVMRIDLERMEVMKDRVLRLPRNPVDMGARIDLRHPFL